MTRKRKKPQRTADSLGIPKGHNSLFRNTWRGMFLEERFRRRVPVVEVVLRTSKTVVPRDQRKEYVLVYGELFDISHTFTICFCSSIV